MQSELFFIDENQIGISQKKRKRKDFGDMSASNYPNFTMELLFGPMNPLDDEDDEDYIPDTEGTPQEHLFITEPESSEVIAKRTRRNVDLHDVDLTQLENILPPSPPSDKDKEDEEEAYRNFLASILKQDDLPLIEEDENDVDFTLPDEENRKRVKFDSEEYRNDRGVHVSKQEIEELMQDVRSLGNFVPLNINNTKRRKTFDKNSPSKSSSPQFYYNALSPFLPNQYEQLRHQLRFTYSSVIVTHVGTTSRC